MEEDLAYHVVQDQDILRARVHAAVGEAYDGEIVVCSHMAG